MRSLLSLFKSKGLGTAGAVSANPRDIAAWVRLIDVAAAAGQLSPHAMALVKSHDLHPKGHAVHAFARDIAVKGGTSLDKLASDPQANVEKAIEELVKWKTAIQCGHSHDVSKGYFIDAEPAMALQ